jgi:hypothetical protein
MRKGVVILALVTMVIGIAVFSLGLRSPIELRMTRIEPSGVLDEVGTELWLAACLVSNVSAAAVEFEWGKTEVEFRVAGQWAKTETMELLNNPRYLAPRGARELLFLVPPPAEACRIRLNYQPELFQWRTWRRLGQSGQKWADKFPRVSRRLWPCGEFGERPPAGRSMRRPAHWRRFTAEAEVAVALRGVPKAAAATEHER